MLLFAYLIACFPASGIQTRCSMVLGPHSGTDMLCVISGASLEKGFSSHTICLSPMALACTLFHCHSLALQSLVHRSRFPVLGLLRLCQHRCCSYLIGVTYGHVFSVSFLRASKHGWLPVDLCTCSGLLTFLRASCASCGNLMRVWHCLRAVVHVGESRGRRSARAKDTI